MKPAENRSVANEKNKNEGVLINNQISVLKFKESQSKVKSPKTSLIIRSNQYGKLRSCLTFSIFGIVSTII